MRAPEPSRQFEPIAVRIVDAVQLRGLGRSSVYTLIDTGEIATAKVGMARLVVVASFQAFIHANAN